MIVYASRTGTRRNLAAMRRRGWRLLISRAGVWRTEGFPWAADNGAWSDFLAQRPFDEEAFERFLAWIEAQPTAPDWLVLPDIVAAGLPSLALSLRYLNRCLAVVPMVLIAVQDGMEAADLAPFVGPSVGIFLGGSTEWKVERMRYWGDFCALDPETGQPRAQAIHYHVARANTRRRIWMAAGAGAWSIDGSSGTRYAQTIPLIDAASRQMDMLSPRRAA